VSLITTTFTSIKSEENGGCFYINNPLLKNFNIADVDFKQVTASLNGGGFYISDISGQVSIVSNSGTHFLQEFSAAKQGSFLYSTAPAFQLSIRNYLIQCLTAYNSANVQSALSSGTSTMAGAFYIENALVGVTSINNEYRYC